MGDRGNIVMERDGDSFPAPLFMYTHWRGSSIKSTLKAALERGRGRWQDGSYLARIIFCELVKGAEMEETGFGLSTCMEDNEHPLLLVNVAEQTVRLVEWDWERKGDPLEGDTLKRWTFEEYVAADFESEEEGDE